MVELCPDVLVRRRRGRLLRDQRLHHVHHRGPGVRPPGRERALSAAQAHAHRARVLAVHAGHGRGGLGTDQQSQRHAAGRGRDCGLAAVPAALRRSRLALPGVDAGLDTQLRDAVLRGVRSGPVPAAPGRTGSHRGGGDGAALGGLGLAAPGGTPGLLVPVHRAGVPVRRAAGLVEGARMATGPRRRLDLDAGGLRGADPVGPSRRLRAAGPGAGTLDGTAGNGHLCRGHPGAPERAPRQVGARCRHGR